MPNFKRTHAVLGKIENNTLTEVSQTLVDMCNTV